MVLAMALLATQFAFEDVFISGRMDTKFPYDTFRIPATCRSKSGTILAFAEGRKSVDDQASNVLVLRRKLRRSAGWEPLQVVVRDEPNSLNNPCVLSAKSGRIWLMYQRYPKGFNERTAAPGYDPGKSCLSFITHSDDDGKSWSRPDDISLAVKTATNRSDASGPGCGIELTSRSFKGRMVFPFNAGAAGHYDVFCVYSDDGGTTWKRGKDAPKVSGTQPNETQIVELKDGSILMNCRNQAAGRFRLQCHSIDGGVTWDTATPRLDLVDPVCQGSLIGLNDRSGTLLFSNPNDPKTRVNGTIRISKNGGLDWSTGTCIVPSSFAYSVMCPLGKGRFGILFEAVDDLGSGREGYRIRYGEMDTQAISGPRPGK